MHSLLFFQLYILLILSIILEYEKINMEYIYT